MKCIVLAGGSGDRLWPLSRKTYPKQFLHFNENRSIFQETITRNIPFCDEFLIITNNSYHAIIDGQMNQFQGISYRVYLEEEGRGTAAALALISQDLEPNELLYVLSSDLMIEGEGYSDAVYQAKELALAGQIALFGTIAGSPSISYGYIRHQNTQVTRFIEKPSRELAERIFSDDDMLWNCGMFITLNSVLISELHRFAPALMKDAQEVYMGCEKLKHQELFFSKERMAKLSDASFDKIVLEQSDLLSVVSLHCKWIDICDFESYEQIIAREANEQIIQDSCSNTTVINTSYQQLVVANELHDTLVVNTPDAIYITPKSQADDIKEIIQHNYDTYRDYFDVNPTLYRPWGTREMIRKEPGYRVRKLTIYPGETLSRHIHQQRNENYSVVSGVLSLQLDDEIIEIHPSESINVLPNQMHRLFNNTDSNLIIIEVDTGAEIDETDMIHFDETDEFQTLPSILQLRPSYKDYLWGGRRLLERYGKSTPYDITAESWELSAHPDGESVICSGTYDGMKFGTFIQQFGKTVCGWKSQVFDRFPILIKFIDANKALSVQIHPDDDYAFVNEGEFGKNEFWYVIDCEPDSYLYCGLKEAISKEEIQERIDNHTITQVLNKIQVSPGDVVFVPAGTIHAIGAGILICEIQQNSNSTYRVYDYNRLDKDGKPRDLHIKKALDVVDSQPYAFPTDGFEAPVQYEDSIQQVLCRCKYFESVKYTIDGEEIIYVDDSSFKSVIAISGTGMLRCKDESYLMQAGDSFFITAGRKRLHIEGNCEVIVTNI